MKNVTRVCSCKFAHDLIAFVCSIKMNWNLLKSSLLRWNFIILQNPCFAKLNHCCIVGREEWQNFFAKWVLKLWSRDSILHIKEPLESPRVTIFVCFCHTHMQTYSKANLFFKITWASHEYGCEPHHFHILLLASVVVQFLLKNRILVVQFMPCAY